MLYNNECRFSSKLIKFASSTHNFWLKYDNTIPLRIDRQAKILGIVLGNIVYADHASKVMSRGKNKLTFVMLCSLNSNYNSCQYAQNFANVH